MRGWRRQIDGRAGIVEERESDEIKKYKESL